MSQGTDWALQRRLNGEERERDDEFSYLSFRLREEFIRQYWHRSPRWGFPMGAGNTLGEHAWITKYSRRKASGGRERFWEGARRAIEGMYSIQKDHALQYRLPWNEETAHQSAQEAYERLFAGKWSPPGRGLWVMGTEFVNGRGDSSALQNCAFLSTARIGDTWRPALPFARLMEMSMLGIGVGFDTRGAGSITLHEPGYHSTRIVHSVEDSREGWCESVEALLEVFFMDSRKMIDFDYAKIRPAGSPIHGFGGTAAGPAPLQKLHAQLQQQFTGRAGQRITSTDIVDIMNKIGKCVIAANIRSSAEIALGYADDEAFLALKDWSVNPERMGTDGWGYTSNNSVLAETGGDYSHLAEKIALNGEPGLFWADVAQGYGRITDGPDERDWRVAGCNPCGEQPLEDNELCTLVETFPTNCDDAGDFIRTLKFAYLYGKTVTLMMTRWPETNEVMIRNRRIGTSMTGIAQFAEKHGWAELRAWQDAGYKEIRRWDRIYSEWLGVRESIRVTSVKPSGTVSLLFGVTPGCHWPRESGYYLRTVRENTHSPFVKVMRDAGYPVEPSVSNPEMTVVITLPVEGPDVRGERDVSLWEKVHLAACCQEHWSDNSVSVTATFNAETEASQIPAVLRAFDGQLKSLSFLPMTDGVYPQAPYQSTSRENWEALRADVRPVNWDALYASDDAPDAEGEMYCATDVCEIPRSLSFALK